MTLLYSFVLLFNAQLVLGQGRSCRTLIVSGRDAVTRDIDGTYKLMSDYWVRMDSTGRRRSYSNTRYIIPRGNQWRIIRATRTGGTENYVDAIALKTGSCPADSIWKVYLYGNRYGPSNDISVASKSSTTTSSTLKAQVFSSGSLTKVIETKTLKKGLTLCKDWDLSIDLKLPSQSTINWRNVFGLQVEGTTNEEPGSRVPAVFIEKAHPQVKLHVSYTPFGKKSNHYYMFPNRVNTGNWINLKISQNNKVYEIKIDDKLVHRATNPNPKSWSNVTVVMGNTYGAYLTALGEYRNFEIYSC